MRPIVLTGKNATTGNTLVKLQDLKDRVDDKEGLLSYVVDQAVMPALKRNWGNTNIKSHDGVAAKAVYERGAKGNVVEIHGGSAIVTFNHKIVPHLDYLIDGRPAVFPVKARVLVFNKQYGTNLLYRRSSKATNEKDIYYLTGPDEDAIAKAVEQWVFSENKPKDGGSA